MKIPWSEYVKLAALLEECERYAIICGSICFKEQRILQQYEVVEKIKDGEIRNREFREAILEIGRADDALVEFRSMWEKLKEKARRTKRGSLEDPINKIIIARKRHPRIRKRCYNARLMLLKVGQRITGHTNWKVPCLEEDAKSLNRFFEDHVIRFKEFFKDDILGPAQY